MYFGLLRTLLDLTKAGKTGILEVTGDGARTRFYLARGNLVFADEGTVGETLGRILTREKVLQESDYERVLEEMSRARTAGQPARFGQVVVRLGILRQEQVDAALAAQVQAKLLKALAWDEAKHTFTPLDALPPDIARFPTDLEPMVVRALRVLPEEKKQELLFDKQHARPKCTLDSNRLATLFRLKTPEARFLSLVDGTRTVMQLLDASMPDAVDPELLLCALTLTEHVTWETDPEAPSPNASFVSKRRRREIERQPPSTKRGKRRSALRSSVIRLATAERKRIKQAASRLRASFQSSPPQRTPLASMVEIGGSSEQGARLAAEQHFRRGRQFLRENKLTDALSSLKRAVDLVPTETEYRIYAVWAASRLLPERELERLTALRVIAKRAIKEDPEFGFAYYVLGHVALREGQHKEARELLERARQLDVEGIENEKPLRIQSRRITAKVVVPEVARVKALSAPFSMREKEAPAKAEKWNEASEQTAKRKALVEEHAKVMDELLTPPPFVPMGRVTAQDLATTLRAPPETGALALPTVPAPPVAPTTPAPSAELVDEEEPRDRTLAMEHRPLPPERTPRPPAIAPSTSGRVTGEPVAATGPVKAAKSKGGKGLVAAAAIALGIAIVGAFVAKDRFAHATAIATATVSSTAMPAPITSIATASATPASTATAMPSSSGSAVPIASASATSIASATPSAASSSAPASSVPHVGGAGTGVIVSPAWAQGRRVFVDGKSVGEGPNAFEVACGSHEIKVGSAGKPKTIDVPCGGRVEL